MNLTVFEYNSELCTLGSHIAVLICRPCCMHDFCLVRGSWCGGRGRGGPAKLRRAWPEGKAWCALQMAFVCTPKCISVAAINGSTASINGGKPTLCRRAPPSPTCTGRRSTAEACLLAERYDVRSWTVVLLICFLLCSQSCASSVYCCFGGRGSVCAFFLASDSEAWVRPVSFLSTVMNICPLL